MTQFTLGELAKAIGAESNGDSTIKIERVSLLEEAGEGAIIYLSDAKHLEKGEASKASALLVPDAVKSSKKPILTAKNPKLAFAKLLRLFHPEPQSSGTIHPTAVIDKTAVLGKNCTIGPYVVIDAKARIGNHVSIGPFAYIASEGTIGDDTQIHARVTVLNRVNIGSRCVLHEGCVIGKEGFGFAVDEEGKPFHVPQVGTVVLEDEVEIGVNCAVDRATLGVTRIRKGTKIDNLVQIAHNCDIGENCMFASLVGVAGSVVIGSGTMIGGLAGVRDHVQIGSNVIITGGSGVYGNLDSGAFVSGFPARPHKNQLKIYALQNRLLEK